MTMTAEMRMAANTTITDEMGAVFGRERLWLSVAIMLVCGCGAAVVAPLVRPEQGAAREALRPLALFGYGLAAGGIASLLPAATRLVALRSGMTRPAAESIAAEGNGWWPLRLVAAALADTPLARRTPEEFTATMTEFASRARGLLSRRSWPICAAAFAVPVLGLVSAWQSWGDHVSLGLQAGQPSGVGAVAWPMIMSIVSGLAAMLAVVWLDQATHGLLARWTAEVRSADVDNSYVASRAPAFGTPSGAGSANVVEKPPVVDGRNRAQPDRPPVTAEGIEGLGGLFRDR